MNTQPKNQRAGLDRRSFLNRGTLAASLLVNGAFKALGADARSDSAADVVQDTTAGKIRGSGHKGLYTFRGVPYGASTEGAGRFMPPSKPQPWKGVRDALEYGPSSPQIQSSFVPETDAQHYAGDAVGTEDCLRLNVWTPGMGSGKRPVMVWLHGGGFTSGSASWNLYSGANLAANHDVVMVGVNHRLNVFGYLYLAELGGAKYAQASNVGQLDIVAALEWVRDNIAGFGGDPANVTIFGQSGGGQKVSTLLGMPAGKGLFHRAISQSASALRGVPREEAAKSAEMLLAKLGLNGNQVDELQKMPAAQLLQAMRGVRGLQLAPVVDGHSLPANPYDPVATPISAEVAMLIGSTETEITLSPNINYDPLDDAALRARVKETLKVGDAAADRVIAVYRQGRPKASNLDIALILGTDVSNYRTGTNFQAERQAALGKAAVYKYYFEWYSPVREGKLRSFHMVDIPFALQNVDVAQSMIGSGPERYPLADKVSTAWTSFARTGNPNHKGLPKWEPFTAAGRATMIFNNQCRAVNDPFRQERLAVEAAQSGRA